MSKYHEAYNKIIGSLNLYRYELFFEKRNEPDSFIKEKKLLQELVDKAKPKKLTYHKNSGVPRCPNCDDSVCSGHDLPKENIDYCFVCGQALDWSEVK